MIALQQYHSLPARRIAGVMSGTSADGVDVAVVELSGQPPGLKWKLLSHHHHALPDGLRRAILALCSGGAAADVLPQAGPAAQVALLDSWVAESFADAVDAALRSTGIPREEIHLVASHGQTVCHLPQLQRVEGAELRATLQVGSGAILAARLGVPVVCDFRRVDMALGGQGAPLVPYADWILFSALGTTRAVQNLGGIGNVTYLPGEDQDGILAFDTGPANMLLDGVVRRITRGSETCDRDGDRAARGTIDPTLLSELLEHPFLAAPPPKSAGHEQFGESFLEAVLHSPAARRLTTDDLLATLTAFSAEAAAQAYRRFLPVFPDEVILGGGGSHNPVLVNEFRQRCVPARISFHEDYNIPAQAKESLAFAILGDRTMFGQPSNIPSATGASRPAILGGLYLPP